MIESKKRPVRVRFAPSPTGTLHVGGARTALFNHLFAKSQGGKFLLRIEDTDQTRYDAEAEKSLLSDLKWLGLQWDEGPEIGGPFEPYRQSARLPIYQSHARELVEKEHAYYCFCTTTRLEELKERQRMNKLPTGYDRRCRTLPPEVIQSNLEMEMSHVIRLKIPLQGSTQFRDFLRGPIEYKNLDLDDLVLLKSDGFPSYHLAHVVDDHQMEISHVLRGDEWIPSTPKHQLIYSAFGWEPPEFVHLPVILAPGGGKLSKRKGAASVTDYRNLGYLPECLCNFLVLLGWSPGEDREIMSPQELEQFFSIERISSKSCAFDEKKLEWMNGQYFIQSSPEYLLPMVKDEFRKRGVDVESQSENYLLRIIALMKDRSKKLTDFGEFGGFFFSDPESYDEKAVRKHFKGESLTRLVNLIRLLKEQKEFSPATLEGLYREEAERLGLENAAALVHPTRLALCGIPFGPSLFEMMATLGKETVLRRMEKAVRFIGQNG